MDPTKSARYDHGTGVCRGFTVEAISGLLLWPVADESILQMVAGSNLATMNLNEIYICYKWYARVRVSFRRKGSDRRSYKWSGLFILGATEAQAKMDLVKQIRTMGSSYKLDEIERLEQKQIAFAFWLNDPEAKHLDAREKQELIQFLQTEKLKEHESNQIRQSNQPEESR